MRVVPLMSVRISASHACTAYLPAGMVMDWREMAGRPTVRGMQGEERWSAYRGAWSGGRKVGLGWREDQWDGRTDSMRGWVIAFCWLVACSAEYVRFLHLCIFNVAQHILSLHPNSETTTHPRLCIDPRFQSFGPDHLLFRINTDVAVFLAGHDCWSRSYDYCGRTAVCQTGDDGGSAGNVRTTLAPLSSNPSEVVTQPNADEEAEEMEMGLLPRNSG